MRRGRRLRWTAAALLPCLLAACGFVGSTGSAETTGTSLEAIAPGVYVHRGVLEDWGPANQGDVSNSGVVVGSRCVAVIDSGGSAAVGRRLLQALRRVTPLPVCYVINTHAHPDHVLGNGVFADLVQAAPTEFVGHARLASALQTRAPYYLNALRRDFGAAAAAEARIVAPTVPVQRDLELDLGDRTLSVRAWPTAHTDADVSVLDVRTRSLFLGDLLFVDHTPVVDGKLKGWLAVMSELRGWSIGTVVPGHGAPQSDWPAALQPQQHYLERLQADVRAALAQPLTLSQTVERVAPDRPDWRLLDVFHRRNVTAAYAELEWEN